MAELKIKVTVITNLQFSVTHADYNIPTSTELQFDHVIILNRHMCTKFMLSRKEHYIYYIRKTTCL